MNNLFGIVWAGLGRLMLTPLVLLVVILLLRHCKRINATVTKLVHPIHQATIFKNFSSTRQWIKGSLLSLGVVFLFIALLQPQWGKKEQTIMQEGRDVLILLDISRSMSAQDLKPNRLEFAKLKIRTLIEKLPSERIGLIVFSGSAFVQCPLTADHAAFAMFLDHVNTEIISSGTTSLDKALNKALEVFSTAEDRKNKLAIVLTDGEDYSLQFDAAQNKALKEQLSVFALGVGTPTGAPIPKLDQNGQQTGHETDESGNVVLSILDEKMLLQLCTRLNGQYQRATYDDSDIDALVARLGQYEKEKFADKKLSLFEEQYPWVLALAWICLALEWIL